MEKYLPYIQKPQDLRKLDDNQLNLLCAEIRETIIDTVSKNGGHLASNLGVVELTVALGQVFSPPEDSVVWDVGHQTYPYKLITGRYADFSSIRTAGGLSGFPNQEECDYDLFTTGHSSTSISSALGISAANEMMGRKGHVVAVIGDGALSGGLAYEGLNNAGRLKRNFIVVLNDNTMSISKNVGSTARHLSHIRTKKGYLRIKTNVEKTLKRIPLVGSPIAKILRGAKQVVKKNFYKSTLFENFGFAYYGPFDGHNVKELRQALENVKFINKPVLLHIVTSKGKGYPFAEKSPAIYHGLSGFDVATGLTGDTKQDFSTSFGKSLCRIANINSKICAITAAMYSGTGLSAFKSKYKTRFFDVGIAEGHAVTFAGGLAAKGMIPVFAVYSSFLQRAYDELIHDAALQKRKVIIAIDRAGIVGEDGKTHQGIFDAAFLSSIPNTIVYSPAYYSELDLQLQFLADKGEGLCAIRYPRGGELFCPDYFSPTVDSYTIYGVDTAKIALITYGRLFSYAAEACSLLAEKGIHVKLVKLNRIIPISKQIFPELMRQEHIFFFEEGIRDGGVGERLLAKLLEFGYNGQVKLQAISDFIPHASMQQLLERLELTSTAMCAVIEHVALKELNAKREKKA